ncbi:MAG: DUF3592 domain-containing protein [Draconibacterium sp.]|nr:DUF3592 domain-containing protein [Draconibacterium sp.]
MKATLTRQDLPGLVLLTIIGLALTTVGGVMLKNAIESKNWPVTNGTVTGSEVAGSIKYYPSITYTFTIEGVDYSSDQISNMNFRTKNKSVAQEVVNRYQVGSVATVHYNSTNPSKSYLEPGINTGHLLLLLFGIIALAIPVFSFIFLKIELKKTSGK